MDFRKMRHAVALATCVMVAGLSACGGGGGDSAVMPTAVTAKSCAMTTGALDVVQSTLINQLASAANSLPAVGNSASIATTAFAQTLDAVDAVTAALTNLAQTQNPQLLASNITGIGNSLLCSGSNLSAALALLPGAQSVPGLAQVQQSLTALLQTVSAGPASATPGADLASLTAQLTALSTQLSALSSSLPAGTNQAYLQQILGLNAMGLGTLSKVLSDLSTFNGAQLVADVSGLLQNTLSALPVASAGQFGIPFNVLGSVTNQLQSALSGLPAGLGTVAGPTLQAIASVLGSAGSGSASGLFSNLLSGALSNPGSGQAGVAQVLQLLAPGTGVNTLLNSLLQAFGGVLPKLLLPT